MQGRRYHRYPTSQYIRVANHSVPINLWAFCSVFEIFCIEKKPNDRPYDRLED